MLNHDLALEGRLPGVSAPSPAEGLRVLVVSPDYPPAHGGIQTLIGTLAERLPVGALEVVTLDAAGAGAYDAPRPVTVHRVRVGARHRRVRIASLSARALLTARRFGPDVALLGHVAAMPAGVALRRLLGIPVVSYTHAEEFRLWPRRCAFAMRTSDEVIAVSRHTERMARAVGAAPDRVHLIHHGVDLPAGTRVADELTAGPPTVLTVARMQDLHKGHDVMLRAMPLVRNAVPDARWVVLGDGPLRGTYEADARRLGVDDAVSFLGAVGDGERDGWFRRADVFAMPTRLPADGLGGEGFGIAYLEAAAYGLPVVAANAGGALDAVDAGRTGLLVAPDDHRQVAGALISLLGDLEYARAMGARAVEWAATFPWQRTADRVAAVLRAAAGGEARR
ncbi:MAG TPA: glycosyltransferase family 4 protein [Solirubrobacteraceae bacterium]|nr:glycosyltransferase family 4 protein [Solirubrobacteraceae bacterium]